jgi:hypothetical protein
MADEDAPPTDATPVDESDAHADTSEDVSDPPDTPETREERIEVALDLLAHLEHDELALSAVVDRIETVTSDPALTREILDTAEMRGLIDRDGARVQTRTGGTFVRFESQVVTREGEFDCRRCGASITTGHYVRFESGELGPFGSSCVRKVTGRE